MKNISVDVNHRRETKAMKSDGAKHVFCFLSAFLLFCVLISPAAAEVDWKLTPTFPTVGDTIKIQGWADPDEELKAEVSFDVDVPVFEGRYSYVLEDIQIPDEFENKFTVRAEGVEDLQVGVNKFVWINLTAEAVDGNASISQEYVPPLSYLVVIEGNATEGNDSVNLNFTASQSLETNSKGKFKYRYDTTSIPPGFFKINIGGSEQIVELKAKEPVAAFCTSLFSGKALKVAFSDMSSGEPVKWYWDFGDGTSSTEESPVHVYEKAGEYTVTLKVENSEGFSSETTDYVEISKHRWNFFGVKF